MSMENEMAVKLIELISRSKDEDIIYIKGRAFLVRPADMNDIDRVNNGNECMD